ARGMTTRPRGVPFAKRNHGVALMRHCIIGVVIFAAGCASSSTVRVEAPSTRAAVRAVFNQRVGGRRALVSFRPAGQYQQRERSDDVFLDPVKLSFVNDIGNRFEVPVADVEFVQLRSRGSAGSGAGRGLGW